MNGVVWPDVPTNRAAPCDRCERDAEPGSALCDRCAAEQLDGCARRLAQHIIDITKPRTVTTAAELAVFRETGVYPTDAELMEATR